jgi:hypothetical protein
MKTELTRFAQVVSSTGVAFPTGSPGPSVFSPQVFELMQFLETQFNKNNLVYRFNYQLHSESISTSAKKPNHFSPFRKEDYYLPFLHYLAIQDDKVSAEDLNIYIQGFLKLNANSLSIHDTFILKSGTTRAVSNIRFAVDFLRKQSLVENRTIHSRRSLQPTMLGILALLLLKLRSREDKMHEIISLTHEVSFYNTKFYYCYYPWMICKTPEELIQSMEIIKTLNQDVEAKQKINSLITEYYTFIADHVKMDLKTGNLILKFDYYDKFLLFVNSASYNWDHSGAILLLRNAYRNLWKSKDQ